MRKRLIRPPVKRHGGKHYLCQRILKCFGEHHTYVEPFGGGASLLLNKEPSRVELYNDLDADLTRLFRVLRDHGEELRRRLSLTPYSEVEFREAFAPCEDELEAARRFFVRLRMSVGGRGETFSWTLHRARRGMSDVVSAWLSMIDEQLPLIIERLRRVQIVQRPAIEVIRTWDSPSTLVYADPPYLHVTRAVGSRNTYSHEMTEEDHRKLAQVLKACTGRVVLSGYASPLYDDLYGGWEQVRFEVANHASGSKRKRTMTEVLWIKASGSHRDQG